MSDPRQLGEDYVTALHAGDVETLRKLFLPEANLYAAENGTLKIIPREDWLAIVGGRQSPKDAGEPREGEVHMIEHLGDDSAVIKVSVAVPPRKFIDFLNVLKIDGDWRVAAKIYHVAE